ncbi:MAG: DUF501 domain-containing protein [Spirochaetes bacterium]|nr:DUF501 domain-containing protein [Spirochaetota bacterium]MBN2769772.1 DUF501 domain-containing protein [Spirochaetota bacterium]
MNIWGDTATDEDRRVTGCQINRKNADPYGIIHRCPWNFPVAVSQKIIDSDGNLHYGNLSNPLWLTCPYLNYEIHELENEGMIRAVNEFILTDREAMERMQDAHAHFYYYRKHLYRHQSGGGISDSLIENFNVGIGGISDTRFIKCLHLHFAHYLVYKQNVAGKIVEELLNKKIYCKDGRCLCLKD